MEKVNLELAKSYINIYDNTDKYEHYRIEEKALNDNYTKQS